jgi:hypothetical protein
MMRHAIWVALLATGANAQVAVPHPQIGCWAGESVAGGSDFASWSTENDVDPYLITHSRDQIRSNGELEQDYNFIDYWFGEPSSPIQARHYLGDDSVNLILPTAEISLEQAKAYTPPETVCYLQKRFSRIDILTDAGYEEFWSIEEGS